MQDVTSEYLKKYKLKIVQPANGYRYSIDSFLLADFVSEEKINSAIEIGGGCGIISFLIHRINKCVKKIEIFEKQERLFKCLKYNYINNKFDKLKIFLRNEDVRYAIQSFIPDIIYVNPPFYRQDEGKISPFKEKAFARHEFSLDLETLFMTFINWGDRKTKFAMVHLFERKKEIENMAFNFNLNIDKVQFVKPAENQKPRQVIYLFSHNLTKTKISESFVYDKYGKYTVEMYKLLNVENI